MNLEEKIRIFVVLSIGIPFAISVLIWAFTPHYVQSSQKYEENSTYGYHRLHSDRITIIRLADGSRCAAVYQGGITCQWREDKHPASTEGWSIKEIEK